MAAAALLPVIGTAAAVAGAGAAIVGAGAQIQQGQAAQEAAKVTAQNLENQGKADYAASQRAAIQKDLETKYLMSTQQAQAAASGAGAGSDAPTIVRLMTETAKRGQEAQENILYQGESSRTQYNQSAAATRKSGDLSFLGGLAGGIGTLTGGLTRSFGTYRQFNPA